MSKKFLNQIREREREEKENDLKENLKELILKLNKGENINNLLKKQNKLVKKSEYYNTYKKHWTEILLIHYKNTSNKTIAYNTLVCSLIKKKIYI